MRESGQAAWNVLAVRNRIVDLQRQRWVVGEVLLALSHTLTASVF
jgi:hypothetical protein